MSSKINLLPYVIRFTVIYAVLLILAAVVTTVLNINTKTALAVLIITTLYTAGKFVKEQNRIPSRNELFHLTWASFATSSVTSLILSIAYFSVFGGSRQLIKALSNIHPGISLAIIIVVFGLYFAQIWFFYWLGAKIQFQALEGRKSSVSVKAPAIWKVIISGFIPGLGSLLIRGWKARGLSFLLLFFTIPISFYFFGPYWGQVLFAGTKYKGAGLLPFIVICVLVLIISVSLAYKDRKQLTIEVK